MGDFFKNLTFFTHGMAFMLFLFICIELYNNKNKNRLLLFLFYEMLFFVFIELKDLAYLADSVWYSEYWTQIQLSVDMWCVPVTMFFMFELISPKWITWKKIIILITPSVILTILFIVKPMPVLSYIMICYSVMLGVIIVAFVFLSSSRYEKYIKRNFSYTEGLSVSWARNVVLILFGYLMLWVLFYKYFDDWKSTVMYYIATIVAWSFIYKYTLRHTVIDVPYTLNPFRKKETDEHLPDTAESTLAINQPDKTFYFTKDLEQAMRQKQLYLNPKLTISDVAVEIGTNRTYLSDYLNKELNMNFYDYVNTFRVEMACQLLLTEPKYTFENIAEQCGFNSISTFRRSFQKIKNCSLSEYKKSVKEENLL